MPLLDERVLILAPNARDALLTQQTLEGRHLRCVVCPDLTHFIRMMKQGAGLGLLAEESINAQGLMQCIQFLTQQPRWSDFPLILIAAETLSAELSVRRYKRLQSLGNLTILERPFHSDTLITAVRSGLRDRKRQYEAHAHLTERQQREDTIRELNENLEVKVLERTRELTLSKDALIQAQKLEAIGRLAGGVAHDFNNIITGILGIIEDVSISLGPTDSHHADLQSAIDAANRAAHLTRQLLAFGRRQITRPTVVVIEDLIHDMNQLISHVLPDNVHLSSDFEDSLGNVLIDRSQLEQVLLNLVLNARDAMPHGGPIKISCSNVTLGKAGADALSDLTPGRYVVLNVTDTGSGIAPETMRHLFEPFFTTKKPHTGKGSDTGTGTGMGLASAYGLIKQYRGDINVKSVLGKGSTFQVFLPRFRGTAKGLEPSRPHRPLAAGGTETILVAEDEDLVRVISVRALKKRGYHVLQAQNAQQALKLSQTHSGTIDLLLTDVVMPGMNGQELATLIKRTRPGTRILYMSGYSRDMVEKQGSIEAGTGFIEKAFSAEKLCHSVREILDQPG